MLCPRQVGVTSNGAIPLDKVFVKQRLDIMTAQHWLSNDAGLKEQIVNLSGQHVPFLDYAFSIHRQGRWSLKDRLK